MTKLLLPLASQGYGSQQLVPAGHWVYDALNALCLESKFLSIADNAPLSVKEIKFYLSIVDYDALSYGGKQLYDKTLEYLNESKFALKLKPVKIGFNLILNPTLLARTNDQIEWSMATDYTGKLTSTKTESLLKSESNPDGLPASALMTEGYAVESSFTGSDFTKPLAVIPVTFDIDDKFIIETQFSLGTSQFGLLKDDYFNHNLRYDLSQYDFYTPKVANASFTHIFDSGWGFNLHVARSGLQIGNTSTGSIIYNSTFDTNVYFHTEIFSRQFKYEMNVIEINHTDNEEKFMYLHSMEVIPWKWLKIGFLEGTLINGGFSLRYMNPLMILHSFGTWTEMNSAWEEKVYGEAHTCAYMGLSLEILPCSNTRIYCLYSQDEMQPPNELTSDSGRAYPDGWGYQGGVEIKIPEEHGGWYSTGFEAIYTTPFLYIKQAKEWSLYSYRYNMQSNGSTPLCSWIGTPFGPDAIGFQTKFGYTMPKQWSAEANYLFLAHGTNSFGIFSKYAKDEDAGRYYNNYYPTVLLKAGERGEEGGLSADEAASIARDFRLTGTVQFTNQIAVKGSYTFNDHITAKGQLMYQFVFNNNNESGNFQQGMEIALALNCSLF
ncbi:hypothetical protein [Treponema sp. C6A8]|uniref:hypothetical protein n=1 Tax=Treponema sp. C6A8 TaxID=1410609 RepID=UPI0006868A6F|nr:hypothetical protein [Treponema sp. C6A8]